MNNIFVALSKLIFNMFYALFCFFPRKDVILFTSRQTDSIPNDFKALGEVFKKRGYESVFLTKKLTKRTAIPYTIHVLREIYYLARCRVCILERYDPVISLIDFKYEVSYSNAIHREFPVEPIVIQLWHAFGAFKRFGYQSVGTKEGHSQSVVKRFQIHRNYSWIICTGEDSRKPFAEAFGYPLERVIALSRPEYESLSQEKLKISKKDQVRLSFLFSPTLRKSTASTHPFRDLHFKSSTLFKEIDANIMWSFHPLENGASTAGTQHDLLEGIDYVVTDYSSIAYEAYLLGIGVLFYTPDISEYQNSPGLNNNPLELCPKITFLCWSDLAECMNKLINGEVVYPMKELDNFIGTTFDIEAEGTTDRIVDFALSHIVD